MSGVSLLKRLRNSIEALSDVPFEECASFRTAMGGEAVTFIDDQIHAEGAPVPAFYGMESELEKAIVAAVQAYAFRMATPRMLTWRVLPEWFETEGRPHVYMRLAFETAKAPGATKGAAPSVAAVHGLDGPDMAVVRSCEQLLAWAMEGDLRALAYVAVRKGGTVGTGWQYGEGRSYHHLLSGAATLTHRIVEDRTQED